MNTRILQIAIVFIWCGMIAGISFLEAPLKFQAPNITLGLGLGIGRLVFQAFNKVEIVFLLILAASLFAKGIGKRATVYYAIIGILLLLETFWLLPILDARAEQVINGVAEPFSNVHYFYIAFDAIKLLLLFVLGVNLSRQQSQGKVI